eukprot:6254640-Lingulodinium_polyedra.AAC.1
MHHLALMCSWFNVPGAAGLDNGTWKYIGERVADHVSRRARAAKAFQAAQATSSSGHGASGVA